MTPSLTFKAKLADPNRRLTQHICTIPSAVVTQAIVAAGSDSVVIDMEHGAVDFASGHAMIAATAGTSCAPLVRVSVNDPVQVKRVLDLGAEGIVFPLIRSADDARAAVASMRYPPNGVRGFGPFIAQSRWGTSLADHLEIVDGNLVSSLLIETPEAVAHIEEICAVPGIDLITPALFDLSTTMGLSGQFDHPDFIAAVTRVETAGKAAAKAKRVGKAKAEATESAD